jgi:hypothetical protein
VIAVTTFYDEPNILADIFRKRKRDLPIVGQKFGRLEFTGRFLFCKTKEKLKDGSSRNILSVECRCECHSIRFYRLYDLEHGSVTGCYCQQVSHCAILSQRKIIRQPLERNLKNIWNLILDRCYHELNLGYHNYGGRGIFMCAEWKDSFPSFYVWAIENGYEKGLELDRKDNDGPYAPWNCKWATRKEQMRNTRKNVYVSAFNERKCIAEWAEDPRCPIGYAGLRNRIAAGMNPEEAITSPSRLPKNFRPKCATG